MKELSIEEKAQRYDEAIERARKHYDEYKNRDNILYVEDMEDIFPEFKESEDERIEKEIVNFINHRKAMGSITPEESKRTGSWIAWLEKQGKLMEALQISNARIGELIEKNYNMGISEATKKRLEDNLNKALEKETPESCNKFLDEQKSANKVEPKFKVSDWVVIDGEVLHIIEVTKDGYLTDEGGLIPFRNEKEAHIWTIKDTKVGDVLAASDGSIFLFKCTIDWGCKHYVALTTDGTVKFNEGLKHFWETSTAVHPATKEQRELLFQKMKEAGYEWDADKKELKKIEQKPAWSEEDEKYINGLIRGLVAKRDIHKQTTFSSDNLDITNTINWLDSLKDRLRFQLEYYNEENLDTIADRFIPEPTWNALEESKEEGSCAAAYDYSQMIAMFKAGVQCIKSLKERYTWKPTEEQMDALDRAQAELCSTEYNKPICDLIDSLNKLRNE